MSSRTFFLSAVLVVGAANAEFSETLHYNDAACEDLNSTLVIDGAYGLNGINAFGECTNLTSFGQPFMSSMFECADNVATLSYYTDDSCSTVLSSNETANNTCIGGQIERCSSEDNEWDIISDWTVEATFYSDADCSTATGVTGEYTMTEVLELYEMGDCQLMGGSSSSSSDSGDSADASTSVDSSNSSTSSASSASSASSTSSNSTASSASSASSTISASSNSSSNSTSTNTTTVSAVSTVTAVSTNVSSSSGSFSSSSFSSFVMNAALRCIDDTIGMVMYDEDDTTCSDDFTMASKEESSCMASIFEDGPYMMTTCSESASADSDDSDDSGDDGDDDDVTSGGVSSLVGGGSFGWSFAAATAATAALAAVLG